MFGPMFKGILLESTIPEGKNRYANDKRSGIEEGLRANDPADKGEIWRNMGT